MSDILIDNVSKEYGDQIVLEKISLHITSRSFVALVGPSGCGKTTFLRLLLGEESATGGSIAIDGVPLIAEPSADRGVVFQRYSVFPHLTVLGNVLLGLEFRGSPIAARLLGARRRESIEAARALIAEVGLAGSEDKFPAMLSGGMQQRLALAQALIMRPKVLLLDEPFGALDALTRAKLQDELLQIVANTKSTVVMVTHDVDEAVLLSDKIVMMTNGPSATIGEVLAIELPRPRSRVELAESTQYLHYRKAVIDFLYTRQAHVEKLSA